MPARAGLGDVRQVDQQPGVEQQRDFLAVLGDGGSLAQRRILRLPARTQAHAVGVVFFHVGRRAHVDVAHRAVDDDRVARIDDAGGIRDLADCRDAERTRHDRDVRGRPAFLQHQRAQLLAVIVEQRRGAHGARHQDGVVGKLLARGRVIAPDQLAHEAVGEIVEIVQALAQVRVGLAHHAGAVVGLHTLHRGLGGQARGHRLVHLVHPAAIMGEHAVGFQNFAMFAAVGDVAPLQHHVEVGAQRIERGIEALQFLLRIVGDQLGDDHARLVQHHMAEPDAVGDREAFELQRPVRGRLEAGLGERGQFSRRDGLGEHHRGGLQRFFLVLRIRARGAVLHHQHAERIAGAQDRDAEERVVDFFAGLRAEREGRMVLGVGQVERLRLARHQADEAFVLAQHRDVHGFGFEAFRSVQFERAVDAQHIDGADLRNHVGGDQHHDLVEAFLRADRFRHHLAEPAQQHARTAERATHRFSPCVVFEPGPGRTHPDRHFSRIIAGSVRPATYSAPYNEWHMSGARQSGVTTHSWPRSGRRMRGMHRNR